MCSLKHHLPKPSLAKHDTNPGHWFDPGLAGANDHENLAQSKEMFGMDSFERARYMVKQWKGYITQGKLKLLK